MKALRPGLLAIVLALAACAAQPTVTETNRTALVERIVKAQRLQEQFDQQLAQQKDLMRDYVETMSDQTAAQGGGELTAEQRGVLNRFMDRTATMFSGKELADRWKADYGKELSVEDLQQIVAYYESPLGQRDVGASKATLEAFTNWMNKEGQDRSTVLIQELSQELQRLQ